MPHGPQTHTHPPRTKEDKNDYLTSLECTREFKLRYSLLRVTIHSSLQLVLKPTAKFKKL